MTFKNNGKIQLPAPPDSGRPEMILIGAVLIGCIALIVAFYLMFCTGCQHFPDWPILTQTPTPAATIRPTAPPLVALSTATPVPIIPTHTPTPIATSSQYAIRVQVSNIPVMTDENKDTLNKRVFFCLKNGADMILIVHRYYQPTWPTGEWWAVWRIEYFRNGQQIAEIAHADMENLPANSATFLIDWSHLENLVVTCEETGESEILFIDNHPRFWTMTEACLDHFPSGSVALRL